MTKTEVAKLLYVIKAEYPEAFRNFTTQDFENKIALWCRELEDYSYGEASAGLDIFISSDRTGFAPKVGQIIDCIAKIRQEPELEMTGMQAWALVRKALANGCYGAEEEFARLPEPVQRAVGSPANIREMAQMDEKSVETVEQSHFIRAYEATTKRMRDEAKIPQKVLALMQNNTKMIEAGA